MIKLDYTNDPRRQEAAALVPGMLLALMQGPNSESDPGFLLMPFVEILAEGDRNNEETLAECLVTVLEVAATMFSQTYAQYDVDPASTILGFVRTILEDTVDAA